MRRGLDRFRGLYGRMMWRRGNTEMVWSEFNETTTNWLNMRIYYPGHVKKKSQRSRTIFTYYILQRLNKK